MNTDEVKTRVLTSRVQHRGWLELVRDVVACANSGGGDIKIYMDDDTRQSRSNGTYLPGFILSDLINAIRAFTGIYLDSVKIARIQHGAFRVDSILIGKPPTPIVFSRPGKYTAANGDRKTVFTAGTLYVCRETRSYTATSVDLRSIIDSILDEQRQLLFTSAQQGLDRTVEGGEKVTVNQRQKSPDLGDSEMEVELSAEVGRLNDTHPYHQTDILREINKRLHGLRRLSSTDHQVIRWLEKVDGNLQYYDRTKGGRGQYTELYLQALIHLVVDDPAYLTTIRKQFRLRYQEYLEFVRRRAT